MKLKYIGHEAITIMEHGPVVAEEIIDVVEDFGKRLCARADFIKVEDEVKKVVKIAKADVEKVIESVESKIENKDTIKEETQE